MFFRNEIATKRAFLDTPDKAMGHSKAWLYHSFKKHCYPQSSRFLKWWQRQGNGHFYSHQIITAGTFERYIMKIIPRNKMRVENWTRIEVGLEEDRPGQTYVICSIRFWGFWFLPTVRHTGTHNRKDGEVENLKESLMYHGMCEFLIVKNITLNGHCYPPYCRILTVGFWKQRHSSEQNMLNSVWKMISKIQSDFNLPRKHLGLF